MKNAVFGLTKNVSLRLYHVSVSDDMVVKERSNGEGMMECMERRVNEEK